MILAGLCSNSADVRGRRLGRHASNRAIVLRPLVDTTSRIAVPVPDQIAVHVSLIGNACLAQRRASAGQQEHNGDS
jgi:hypothetical protein